VYFQIAKHLGIRLLIRLGISRKTHKFEALLDLKPTTIAFAHSSSSITGYPKAGTMNQ
jgi:hypothetical protein